MILLKKSALPDMARVLAHDAHEYHFRTRRGIWYLEDAGCLCVFNNNPYANYPKLRDRETRDFGEAMKKAGIKVLAYATYPLKCQNNAGYTYAMLLDAGADQKQFVINTLNDIVAISMAQIRERRPTLGLTRPSGDSIETTAYSPDPQVIASPAATRIDGNSSKHKAPADLPAAAHDEVADPMRTSNLQLRQLRLFD
jgi:hypothetical protein